MGENANSEGTPNEPEKPVSTADAFPPFPEPTDTDFDEDINLDERNYYKEKFLDLKSVIFYRLHCTACDRHLGCSAKNENRMRSHPMLRTLVCHTCHTFYNSGEFDKGDDGSELYCRWCGQGGQVYCCSDCPHVFCAKCIKRNLGMPKIKEIENTDDWKCFKCNPKCLWDLRALCWALLRYCELKNKLTYTVQDPQLKDMYQKDCAADNSECCKNKGRRKSKIDDSKKKVDEKNAASSSIVSKIPATIQVKKFASMVDDSFGKQEKKPQKRSASPVMKPIYIKSPVNIAPMPGPAKLLSTPASKKIKMGNTNFIPPVRFANTERKGAVATYGRIKPINIRPAPLQIPMMTNHFNGFSNTNTFYNDNINLSLDNLTQGLDMTSADNNDVICTPDFPLEPLCEVMEENTDDDVQCITPGPAVTKKVNTNTPPPLIPRVQTILSEGSSDNIIQMTENDVTVNAATGGLKFRVDPQTLSSNKMYRLPDGRIFAINANPSMPGGYSATIVAVTENLSGKVASKGPTFAAKLSAIPAQTNTISVSKGNRSNVNTPSSRMRTPKSTKATKALDTTATASVTSRSVNSEIPVEWLRFSILDAVDSLEYSLSRLHKVKKEATSMNLRLCTVPEMKNIHKSLERLLHTSSTRFNEIRQNLNKDMKQYLARKKKANTNISEDDDDDDDVEILNDGDNDDPIFIDENSVDSNLNDTNCNESHDVDLTIVCSDHNDSGENIKEYSKSDQTNHKNNSNDDGYETSTKIFNENLHILKNRVEQKNTDCEENEDLVQTATCEKKENLKTSNITHAEDEIISLNEQRNINDKEISVNDDPSLNTNEDVEMENKSKNICNMEEKENTCDDVDKSRDPKSSDVLFEEGSKEENLKEEDEEKQLLNEDRSDIDKDSEKIPDTDMSDEMINNLLSDENPKQILGT